MRLPAEWEKQSGVQLTWPDSTTPWYEIDKVIDCYVNIAAAISSREKLLVVTTDPAATKLDIAVRAARMGVKIDVSGILFAQSPINDTWARDHGGISVWGDEGEKYLYDFVFNGWGLNFASNLDNQITKKIFFDGTGYAGTIDWCLDAENGFIYTYGGRNGGYKLLKKFRLPHLADSDAKGEVHLTDADVLDETRLDSGINIWQGSIVRGRYAYLPDGYQPYELFIHVVDLEQDRIVLSKNVTDLFDEPEGICLKDGYAWVVSHTAKEPRHSVLWRFSLQ